VPGEAVTIWDLAQGSLDGLGSWIATVNDPAAQPGQLVPFYAYVHEFYFEDNIEPSGFLALVMYGGAKYAEFVVDWGDDRVVRARIPFSWTGGRFYLPVVYRVGEGIWGAWVFDHSSTTWTFIAPLFVPPDWGRIAGRSFTYVNWFGDAATTCGQFPRADVLRMAPIGFVGTSTTPPATLTTHETLPLDCPSTATNAFGGTWARYQVGATSLT
jgi:hypothetical protein